MLFLAKMMSKADKVEHGNFLNLFKYISSCDPGFSYTSKMTDELIVQPSKQLFKNSGNVSGRNDLKLLAQLAGACPVQEI